MISVKKVKRLLNYLDQPYSFLNDKIEFTKKGEVISIENPIFPINLNSEQGALILGAIVSDGCVYYDKKARGVIRTKYSTNEDESINLFIDSVNNLFGKVHIQKEFVRNCITLKIGSSIVGDTLLKSGAILGQKAKVNGEVPWLIRYGPDKLKKAYLRSAFSDEASVYVGKNSSGYIILSRYKHLSNICADHKKELMKLEEFMSIRKFPTGHVNKSIARKRALALIQDKTCFTNIFNSAPNLLLGESRILKEFGIETRIYSRALNKTHKGNYSLCCDLFINKKDSLLRFYQKIGFSLSSKQEKLIKLIRNMR